MTIGVPMTNKEVVEKRSAGLTRYVGDSSVSSDGKHHTEVDPLSR